MGFISHPSRCFDEGFEPDPFEKPFLGLDIEVPSPLIKHGGWLRNHPLMMKLGFFKTIPGWWLLRISQPSCRCGFLWNTPHWTIPENFPSGWVGWSPSPQKAVTLVVRGYHMTQNSGNFSRITIEYTENFPWDWGSSKITRNMRNIINNKSWLIIIWNCYIIFHQPITIAYLGWLV